MNWKLNGSDRWPDRRNGNLLYHISDRMFSLAGPQAGTAVPGLPQALGMENFKKAGYQRSRLGI